jgi:CRP/FNR family transcriptional regulator
MAASPSFCGQLPDCATCNAKDRTVFSDLGNSDLNVVSTSKGSRVYGRGEVIFYAGDQPSGLFCISQGRVKIYKVGRDGREQIIRLAGSGDVMGYRSLLSSETYAAYAVPLVPTQICHIPKVTFSTLLSTNADFSIRMMRLLATELRTAEEKIVEMAYKPVSERVAETLLLLQKTYGLQQDQVTIDISMTRFDLANLVGSAMESVSRQLSKLRRDGVIDFAGKKIKIMNHRALVEAANLYD